MGTLYRKTRAPGPSYLRNAESRELPEGRILICFGPRGHGARTGDHQDGPLGPQHLLVELLL